MAASNVSDFINMAASNVDALATEAETASNELDLDQKCHSLVEEVAQLVDRIKEYQEKLIKHQQFTQNAKFVNQIDAKQANDHTATLVQYLDRLWGTINDRTTRALPLAFSETLSWIYAQDAALVIALEDWKKKQRIARNGGSGEELNAELDGMKNACDKLETIALGVQSELDRYFRVLDALTNLYAECVEHAQKCKHLQDKCKEQAMHLKAFVPALLQKGMIVYQQPPAVVRRSGNENATRSQKISKIPFDMEVKFLTGWKSGLLRASLEMEALLISEQQARAIVAGTLNTAVGQILPTGKLTYPTCNIQPSADGYIYAKFCNARLQSVEKATDSDTSRVMYHILFRAKTEKRTANGTSVYYPFWAISTPFSVVINANRQERYKRALMFWTNSFDIDDKTSLSTHMEDQTNDRGRIKWQEFFHALNMWFKQTASENYERKIERGLEAHEAYIMEKIGLKEAPVNVAGANVVTWDMFYKRRSADTKITFWEWIYGIAEYVNKFPQYWESGLLMGFGSRITMQKLLESCLEPSMVLKFSDGRPGKMVASYVSWSPQRKVEHVIFDDDDDSIFAGRSLVECIRLSTKLQCVKWILTGTASARRSLQDLYALEAIKATKINGSNRSDGYVSPGTTFVWGEVPCEPVYTVDYREPSPSADMQIGGNISSPQSVSSVDSYASFDSMPAFRKWISSSSGYQTQSPQMYTNNTPRTLSSMSSIDSTNSVGREQSPSGQAMQAQMYNPQQYTGPNQNQIWPQQESMNPQHPAQPSVVGYASQNGVEMPVGIPDPAQQIYQNGFDHRFDQLMADINEGVDFDFTFLTAPNNL